jgi:hypothetical protein
LLGPTTNIVRGEIKNKGDSFNKKTTIRDGKVFIS